MKNFVALADNQKTIVIRVDSIVAMQFETQRRHIDDSVEGYVVTVYDAESEVGQLWYTSREAAMKTWTRLIGIVVSSSGD